MLSKDSGSATPVPPGSPASPLSPPQPNQSSPAMSPQAPWLSQQPFPQSPAVTSSVRPSLADQILLDDVSQLSLRPLALTLPTTESVSVSLSSSVPLTTSSFIASLYSISDCPHYCAITHSEVSIICDTSAFISCHSYVHCCALHEYEHAVCATAAYYCPTADAYKSIFDTAVSNPSRERTCPSAATSNY